MENQQTAEANGTPEVVLSVAQVKTILDNVEKESPNRWPAAIKTLVVEAFAAIERFGAVASNLVASITQVGIDLDEHKANYDKLVLSHRRLAEVTIKLQDRVNALKPEGADAASGIEEVLGGTAPGAGSTTEKSGTATAANGSPTGSASPGETPAGGAPDAPVSQEIAEAMMNAAIANAEKGTGETELAFVEPIVASPSSGGRRRGGNR